MALSKTDAALDALYKAIDSDPSSPFRTSPGLCSNVSEPAAYAIKVWQDLLKVVADDPVAISNLTTLLFRSNRYSEAVPLLKLREG